MNFCLYPAGAWATAIAIHLDRIGHNVTIVPHLLEEAMHMTEHRESPFLPGCRLRNSVQIATELKPALMEADCCIIGAPSQFLRDTCRRIKAAAQDSARCLRHVLVITKGLEQGTNLMPSQVLEQELGDYALSVLSGPTFASQLAAGKVTAIVLAGNGPDDELRELQEGLSGPMMRVYTTRDMIGVGLGGSIKNVYAIGAGCCDGLELGDNAKAALLTRALAEMVRVSIALGGQAETIFGLSGFGDLVLTCNGDESRNRTFGESLGRGESIKQLLDSGKTVEGFRSCAAFHSVCKEHGIDAPILNEIYAVLYEGRSPAEAIGSLMSRSLKAESPLGK